MHHHSVFHGSGYFIEMLGPYFFAFDGMKYPFRGFGVVPEIGL